MKLPVSKSPTSSGFCVGELLVDDGDGVADELGDEDGDGDTAEDGDGATELLVDVDGDGDGSGCVTDVSTLSIYSDVLQILNIQNHTTVRWFVKLILMR